MDRLFNFERLSVWEDAMELLVLTYQITKDFPDAEKFGLTAQLRRSALSISSNIAEGSGRIYPKDQARFYQIAFSSLLEAVNQVIAGNRLHYIDNETLILFREKASFAAYKLNKLHESTTS